MGWINQLGGILQRYSNVDPRDVNGDGIVDDFERVAQAAPPAAVAGGLAEAFRSQQTPPFPDMLSRLFGQSQVHQRAGMLSQIVATLGPSLVANILGRRGMHIPEDRVQDPGELQKLPQDAVRELAAEAEKKDPSIVDRVSEFYAAHPTLVQALGTTALAVAMNHMYRRRAA